MDVAAKIIELEADKLRIDAQLDLLYQLDAPPDFVTRKISATVPATPKPVFSADAVAATKALAPDPAMTSKKPGQYFGKRMQIQEEFIGTEKEKKAYIEGQDKALE